MPDYKAIGPSLRFLSPVSAGDAGDFQMDNVDEADLLKGCLISPQHMLEVPSDSGVLVYFVTFSNSEHGSRRR